MLPGTDVHTATIRSCLTPLDGMVGACYCGRMHSSKLSSVRALESVQVLLCALTTALLAGCGAPPVDTVTVEFWAMGREGEVAAALVTGFEQENPGIRVQVQQLPWKAAHAKLLTAFAGDATPDVAQLGNTWIPEFAALGALAPLDARVDDSASIDQSDYFDGIWRASVVGGALLGVPWYVDTRLLFYRSDLLARAGFSHPPRDHREWRRMMQAIKGDAGDERYAVLLPLDEFEPLVALGLQQDAPMLRDGGRFGNFQSDEFVATLAFYLSLFEDGLAPAIGSAELSNVWNEFDRGYFAFHITGPWNLGEFRRRLPEERQHIWSTAPLPGPDGPGESIAGGSSLVLFAAGQQKDAAWKLIEYLSRPEVQRRFYELTGDLPPRRDSWEDGRFDDARVQAFRSQLERVMPTPAVPEWERIATQMRLVTERAVHEGWSAAHAAKLLDARVDRILEKRRWILTQVAERRQ